MLLCSDIEGYINYWPTCVSSSWTWQVTVLGRSLSSLMMSLLRGQIPAPLKLFMMVDGFNVSSQALLNTFAKLYLSIVLIVLHMWSATATFQFLFIGLKKPTSHGCKTWVVCGGRQYNKIPSSIASFAVSRFMCEECPSNSKTTGRAGGIFLLKWV